MLKTPFRNCLLWGCMLLALTCNTCSSRLTFELPDVDIVYQSKDHDRKTIGFINADGLNHLVQDLDFYANRPIWSLDGKSVLVLRTWGDFEFGEVDVARSRGGRLVRLSDDHKIRTCKNKNLRGVISAEPIANHEDHQILIVNAALEVIRFDYESCKEISKYVDIESFDVGTIEAASLTSDGRFLVYALATKIMSDQPEYVIKILDTAANEERDLVSGTNPRWSPDDQWIAYVGWDGIHMMTSDGKVDRLLVEYDSTRPQSDIDSFMSSSPAPYWSPNGEWLVYHKCTNAQKICEYAKDFSIYKLEISTGKEVLLVEGGAYPHWKGN